MKKLLLALDIGNVCVKIAPHCFAEKLGLATLPETLYQLYRDFETGIIRSEDEFLRNCADFFHGSISEQEIKSAFNSILCEPVSGMADVVSEFEKMGVQAVFFSDISPTHLTRTEELFPAFYRVSGGLFSFESGAQKPSARMFDRFERLYGIPDLYVDDRLELIEAAKKHGWNAIVFTSAEDLRKKLLSLS